MVLSVKSFQQDCMSVVLLNAMVAAHYPDESYLHQWRNGAYLNIGEDLSRRAVIFSRGYCAGAASKEGSFDITASPLSLFDAAPFYVKNVLANEVLRALSEDLVFDTSKVNEVLWGSGESFKVEPSNSGRLEDFLPSVESFFSYWNRREIINENHLTLARSLSSRLVKENYALLTIPEWSLFQPGREGEIEVRETLKNLNVTVPLR